MPRNYASLLLLQTLQVNTLLHTLTNRSRSAAHQHWFPLKSCRSSGHLWPPDIHNIYLFADMGERPYCRATVVTHTAGVQLGRGAALLTVYTAHPFSRAPQGSPLWDALFICSRLLWLHPLAQLTASISSVPALTSHCLPSLVCGSRGPFMSAPSAALCNSRGPGVRAISN